jgi:flagellar biosynthesis/type III secretory pathway protein FliH
LFVEILGRDGERPMKTTADKLREEGKEVGRSEGLSQGLSQGQARVLLALLSRRFGALTQAQQDRITTATSDQLEAIALRILDAKTIDEALAG